MELEIEGTGANVTCKEAAGPTPNDCKVTVTFDPVPELEVKFVRVRYTTTSGNTVTPFEADITDLQSLENRLLSIYPVASIDRETGFLDMGDGVPQAADLNARLENMRLLDLCFSILGCDRLYYGAVDQTGSLAFGTGTTGGLANDIPGTVSSGVIRDGTDYGRNRHAHEIAHTMGISHSVTATTNSDGNKIGVCNEVAASTANTYPFFETVGGRRRPTIGPLTEGDEKIVFGWDSLRNSVIDPERTFSLMGYCGNERWVSSENYHEIKSYIESNYRRRILQGGESTNVTVVRAIIDLDSMEINFLPSSSVVLPIALPPPGSSSFELVGSTSLGGEIFRLGFKPITFSQDLEKEGDVSIDIRSSYAQVFLETPPSGILDAVWIEQNRVMIGDPLPVSPNAPAVTVVFPNGGESLSGDSTTIVWTANDPDPLDSLFFSVLFSPDGGTTWNTLITDYSETSLEIPLNALGETSTGLIRVQASDGFNTADDVSDGTFISPNNPPVVQIVSPVTGDFFVSVQPITFESTSSDTEDGSLQGSQLMWYSDKDGFIGQGRQLTLLA